MRALMSGVAKMSFMAAVQNATRTQTVAAVHKGYQTMKSSSYLDSTGVLGSGMEYAKPA